MINENPHNFMYDTMLTVAQIVAAIAILWFCYEIFKVIRQSMEIVKQCRELEKEQDNEI